MASQMKYVAKLVCFGAGGDSVEWGGGCRSTGYGSPERPHAAEPEDGKEYPDGTPVIDKRPAVKTKAGFRHVFNGPIVQVDLEDEETEDLPEVSSVMAGALSEGGNEYGALLTLHKSQSRSKPGALDFVSIKKYVDGWREVGARIGFYKSGKIVWEDECDAR
ncbi:hypothetical protein VN12_26670 [Pirellula sp. SH-Sr6A]|uniref:hypothetical protein n=1 Tax=Pirellula sp. SH-Sr6A TaxID=1632865 RepID=UPI00078B1B6E|nr:hypothetical protein [Pirellula sp. SH-Sr6A]AMV35705.1 hypothetical protein VN12_26670 [Pirellula sp. SH-Sr6A]